MAQKEYRVTVYEDGTVDWKSSDGQHVAAQSSMKRFREFAIDNLEQKKDVSVMSGPTAKDTGDYKGVQCGGCAKCDSKTSTSVDIAWEKCKQCDSVVCKWKHACKNIAPKTEHVIGNGATYTLPPDGIYGVWCEPKGHAHDPRWFASKETSYEEAAKEADNMNRANQSWHYSARWIRAS
jgi:hypothetical protein